MDSVVYILICHLIVWIVCGLNFDLLFNFVDGVCLQFTPSEMQPHTT